MKRFGLNNIQHSPQDLSRNIKLPQALDENLAYYLGAHLGDAHMKQVKRKNGAIESQISFFGHAVNDLSWYLQTLIPLIHRLFNFKPRLFKVPNEQTVRCSIGSRAIVDFLHTECLLPLGSKKESTVPKIILESDVRIKSAFIRGFADTDMSLVFKNRHKNINYYPVIDCQLNSKRLFKGIVELLEDLDISVHEGVREKSRYDKKHESYYFQINGVPAVENWMQTIGFDNENQITKYQVWKKIGHVPPKTTILDRRRILSGSN